MAEFRPLLEARLSDFEWSNGFAGNLRLIRLGIERQLVAHDDWVALGWCELRAENVAVARKAFIEASQRVRHSPGAAAGLGYAALRSDDPVTAIEQFSQAVRQAPTPDLAAEGLRLAVERLPDGNEASRLAREATDTALRRWPLDPDLLHAHVIADRQAGGQGDRRLKPGRPDVANAAAPESFARAGEDYLELRGDDGRWRPLFVKGVNLGPALPGRFASEAPQDDATWSEWLAMIDTLGANAVRVYTLQPPAFYRALNRHNSAPGARRLWLLQGVWADLPPGENFDDPGYVADFEAAIARTIDAVHGDLALSLPHGHAQGVYDTDVSSQTLAWIVGREWEPYAVVAYDAMRPGRCDVAGEFVNVDAGAAMECWIGQRLEYAAAYEARRHGQARPLTFANWPTLDPLHHPTEATRAEEDRWRLELDGTPLPERSAPAWDDDAIAVDAARISGTAGFAPGVFASYHVYPNFPYFMNLEPAYAEVSDAQGVNRFAGYLRALKRHHGRQPVLIAEFGMSTSRGVAHLQPERLDHGGQHEPDAMRADARLARTIFAERMAGGVVFEFMDEWFKSTWSTGPFEVPEPHRPYWFNAESPEQAYGLWAVRPEAPVRLDGDAADWADIPTLATVHANGEVDWNDAEGWVALSSIRAAYDAGYLYLLLETQGRGPPDWDRVTFSIGLDTYAANRGERKLPAPADCAVGTGVEFAIVLRGPDDSALLVTPPYRRRHPAESGETLRLASPLEPTGGFEMPTLVTNRERYTRDGTLVPERSIEQGRLRFGSLDPQAATFDTRADVALGAAHGVIELRLPWGLLNFADPSSARVLHAIEAADELGTRVTDGIRIHACARDSSMPATGSVLPRAGKTAFLKLDPWTALAYRLEPKQGLEQLAEALHALPDTLGLDSEAGYMTRGNKPNGHAAQPGKSDGSTQ